MSRAPSVSGPDEDTKVRGGIFSAMYLAVDRGSLRVSPVFSWVREERSYVIRTFDRASQLDGGPKLG